MEDLAPKGYKRNSFNPYENMVTISETHTSKENENKDKSEIDVDNSADKTSSKGNVLNKTKNIFNTLLFDNLCNKDTLLRILFTIVFLIVGYFMAWFALLIAIFQSAHQLIFRKNHSGISSISKSFYVYIKSVLKFILFLSDERPLPFNEKETKDDAVKNDEINQNDDNQIK